MSKLPDPHVDPERLEKYSMGSISRKQATSIEEHLLICATCRWSLQRTDEFITAMKSAGAALRRSPRKRAVAQR